MIMCMNIITLSRCALILTLTLCGPPVDGAALHSPFAPLHRIELLRIRHQKAGHRINQVVVGLVRGPQVAFDLHVAVNYAPSPARQRGEGIFECRQVDGVGLVSEEDELLWRADVPPGYGCKG